MRNGLSASSCDGASPACERLLFMGAVYQGVDSIVSCFYRALIRYLGQGWCGMGEQTTDVEMSE